MYEQKDGEESCETLPSGQDMAVIDMDELTVAGVTYTRSTKDRAIKTTVHNGWVFYKVPFSEKLLGS